MHPYLAFRVILRDRDPCRMNPDPLAYARGNALQQLVADSICQELFPKLDWSSFEV